jgi:Tol biopolymer transport system component
MNADGSDVHTVLACRQPACFGDESPSWSPHGDEIAFVWGHDPHYRIDAVAPDGSGHRTIYDCVSPCLGLVGPSWSPDGTKVVFTYIADSPDVRRDVYVVAADGGGLTKLTSGDVEACCPAWQPVPVAHPATASP